MISFAKNSNNDKNKNNNNNNFCFQINTVSGDTVQMQLEYKSMHKRSIDQPMSSSFSATTSMAVAMGYEALSKRTIPMESVFSGMGDLQDKIRPMPVAVRGFPGSDTVLTPFVMKFN